MSNGRPNQDQSSSAPLKSNPFTRPSKSVAIPQPTPEKRPDPQPKSYQSNPFLKTKPQAKSASPSFFSETKTTKHKKEVNKKVERIDKPNFSIQTETVTEIDTLKQTKTTVYHHDKPESEIVEIGDPIPSLFASNPDDWVNDYYAACKNIAGTTAAYAIGTIGSGQAVINSLLNSTGISPKNLSWNGYTSLRPETILMSVAEGSASAYVNVRANTAFTLDFYKIMKKSLKDFKHKPIQNVLSIFFGGYSAMAPGALTYEAWVFTGVPAIPIFMSIVTVSMVAISRVVGMKKLAKILENMFGELAELQKKAIYALENLNFDARLELSPVELRTLGLMHKQSGVFTIKQLVDDLIASKTLELDTWPPLHDMNLDEQDKINIKYEQILLHLIQSLTILEPLCKGAQVSLFNSKTACDDFSEYTKSFISAMMKFTFATVFGCASGAIFTEKGWDFIKLIGHVADTNWEAWQKILSGVGSGIGSGALYAASAAEFPGLLGHVGRYIKNHFFETPWVLAYPTATFAVNYLASGSMANSTRQVQKDENNILGLLNSDYIKPALPAIVQTSAGIVNIASPLRGYKEQPADVNFPTLQDVLNRFMDPNTNRISESYEDTYTAPDFKKAFQHLSIFNNSTTPEMELHTDAGYSTDVALQIN